MEAKIVIGTQFGDEGKGLVTDMLCSRSERPIVVRFSGGQQAGHTVIINGKKHVHSNYGSGTLRGVPTYFTEHTCFYLSTMAEERRVLGVEPELYIHPLAKVTTPYDVAWNRITERKNGHSSCGLGIAATMKRNIETPYKLFAIDCQYERLFLGKLKEIKSYYRELAQKVGILEEWTNEAMKEQRFHLAFLEGLFQIRNYDVLETYENVIFEGSQGIMLDMDHGVFPHVTYANTTSKNALEVAKSLRCANPEIHYVTRCYQTRHGNGWMSNEREIPLVNNKEEINVTNRWQGKFRTGELDYDLLNHAISIDRIYSGSLNANLVVTCNDQRPDFSFDEKRIIHKLQSIMYTHSAETPICTPQKSNSHV